MKNDLEYLRPAHEPAAIAEQFNEGRQSHEFYGVISIQAGGVFLCDSTGNELSLSALDGVRHFDGRPVRVRGLASNSKLLAWSIEPTYDQTGSTSV